MSERDAADAYLRKALASLAGAESEWALGRFDNCVNRAYYACFQAAIAALLRDGIRAAGGQWAHSFVQSQFVGVLVNRRHRYPAAFRTTLTDLQDRRHIADYQPESIGQREARRLLDRSRAFVAAVE